MKKKIILSAVLIVITLSSLIADEDVAPKRKRMGRAHRGVYVSLTGGSQFGMFSNNVFDKGSYWSQPGFYENTYEGFGILLDGKAGYAVIDNLIAHATVAMCPYIGTVDKMSVELSPEELRLIETFYGVGLTYFFMPTNWFISGSVGSTNYSISDQDEARKGIGYQVAIASANTTSKRFSISYGLYYSYTSGHGAGTFGGSLNSHKVGLAIGVIYN